VEGWEKKDLIYWGYYKFDFAVLRYRQLRYHVRNNYVEQFDHVESQDYYKSSP
jgi:hypothetical protein